MLQSLLPLLALLAAAGLAWALWLLPREVFLNAAMIKADGANDSLKQGFHARRTWIRFWQWLACTALGSLPPLLWGTPWVVVALDFLGLGLGLAGFFAAAFTPCLNAARGLDKWYVSFASRAASWPDSKLAAAARAAYPNEPAKQVEHAARALERLSGQLVFGTAVAAALPIAAALILLTNS